MIEKDIWKKLENFGIPPNMINRASISVKEIWQPIQNLLDQRMIPEIGWSDHQIRLLIDFLSSMDSDKDPKGVRIGEREARLSTPLLNELSGGFNHGIGRSGNLLEAQPKAAGASLMQVLTNQLILSLIRSLGLPNIKNCVTVPMGTGMALGMALRGLINFEKIDLREKSLVLMPRIDHKSPQKGIDYVGCIVLQIATKFGSNYFAPEGVYCPFEEIEKKYQENKSKIAAIVSTTTFFSPRVPDDIKSIAKFASENNLIHIVNNAYGVQCPDILKILRASIDAGRVDAIVQSTDKNFLTPIGGSVIATPETEKMESISRCYAGRASAIPILQLLVSLLSIGKLRYEQRLLEQQKNKKLLDSLLTEYAIELDERVLSCDNPISSALTLEKCKQNDIKKLGGFLYNLRVTGPRIINPIESTFGTCTEAIKFPYLVMNAAIGTQKEDVIESVQRLKKAIAQLHES